MKVPHDPFGIKKIFELARVNLACGLTPSRTDSGSLGVVMNETIAIRADILASRHSHGVAESASRADGALLSVWPAVAFISCTELFAWTRGQLQVQSKRANTIVRTAPVTASASASKVVPDAPPKMPVLDLIAAAEEAFLEAKNGGPVPSLQVVQGEMKIGQGKAQTVQRHFLNLQAAA